MGCRSSDVADRHRRQPRPTARALRGIDVDMADISDLVPTVAAVACSPRRRHASPGVGFIRGKESDRLGDLARELGALGGVGRGDRRRARRPSLARSAARRHAGDPPRPPAGDGVRRRRHGGRRDRGRRSRRRHRRAGPAYWQMLDGLAAMTPHASPPSTSTARSPDPTASCRSCAAWRAGARSLLRLARRAPPMIVAALARRDRDRLKALATDAVFRGVLGGHTVDALALRVRPHDLPSAAARRHRRPTGLAPRSKAIGS